MQKKNKEIIEKKLKERRMNRLGNVSEPSQNQWEERVIGSAHNKSYICSEATSTLLLAL